MRRSAALLLYRIATSACQPFIPFLLRIRAMRGREDHARLDERLGLASEPRPPGRLAWLHGASVGECLSLLPCIDALLARGFKILVTSGTLSAARILQSRLPAGSFHQFLPLDLHRYASRFLDHWRPDIVLVAESEIWPNLFRAIKAGRVPLVLINARLSAQSFARWQKAPKAAAEAFGMIDLCLAQSAEDAERFLRLGAPEAHGIGNLKFDVAAPSADAGNLAELTHEIGARPAWAAVSTHAGEEALVAEVHLALRATYPSLLTIIAPRHPGRAEAIVAMLQAKGLRTARRSLGAPIATDTEIYLADTLGETGLIYRLTSLAFLGRSLASEGGQNPIEAAKLGCAILHGPHVANFREVYAALDAGGGAFITQDRAALTRAVASLLADAQALRSAARAAARIAEANGGAIQRAMAAIEPYLVGAR